jgi:hypothetical protein
VFIGWTTARNGVFEFFLLFLILSAFLLLSALARIVSAPARIVSAPARIVSAELILLLGRIN